MQIEQIAVPLVRQLRKTRLGLAALGSIDEFKPLFDPAAMRDPFPAYEEVRGQGAVVHNPKFRQWYALGYEECKTLLSSPDVNTSGQSQLLLTIRPYNKLDARAQQFLSDWLLFTAPPEHTRLRSLVSRAFTPRQVQRLEERMADLVGDLLEAVDGQPTVEVCEAFCNVLPTNVIGELLGIPAERWNWAREMTENIISVLDVFGDMDPHLVNATVAELDGYFGALCDERRRNPTDDLISGLVHAEIDGDRLSSSDLLAMIGFILGAGHETTANALGLAIVNLARNTDQRALVAQRPELWPSAIDEFLRFDTPVAVVARTTTAPVQLGDTRIDAGENTLAFLAAANRDPNVFDDPNELRLDRAGAPPLLAFGHGIHYCLGASLAKLEMRVALPAFLDAFGDYTIDEATIEWPANAVLRRVANLHVTRG